MEVNFNQPQRQSLVGILVIFLESIFQVLKALPIVVVVLLKSNPKSILVWYSVEERGTPINSTQIQAGVKQTKKPTRDSIVGLLST